MNIQLSEHFTYSKLLKFTLPSMVMMVFTSIYGVVDGVFVSNYVGSESFAAVNLIMPFLMILGAVGFMLGSGGSALVSYTLGTGDSKRANEIFSLLIYVLIGLGAVFTVGGILFLAPMSRFLGADETMLPICVSYGRIVLSAMIPFMLQSTFQSFLVTAERPNLGLYVTVAAGVANMVLDALFIAVFKWGVIGAALLLARPLSMIFVSYDAALLAVTVRAFSIYSFSFLLCGYNIYASSFFTALNDGFTSALISFARTLIFEVSAVLLLPLVLGTDGVWSAVIVAELAALVLSATCLMRKRKKYGYA